MGQELDIMDIWIEFSESSLFLPCYLVTNLHRLQFYCLSNSSVIHKVPKSLFLFLAYQVALPIP